VQDLSCTPQCAQNEVSESNRISKLSAKLNLLSGVDWDKVVGRGDRLRLISVFPPRKLKTFKNRASYI
jgi:hypothetical protein